jgi:Fe(3+) dicitrate transport protein
MMPGFPGIGGAASTCPSIARKATADEAASKAGDRHQLPAGREAIDARKAFWGSRLTLRAPRPCWPTHAAFRSRLSEPALPLPQDLRRFDGCSQAPVSAFSIRLLQTSLRNMKKHQRTAKRGWRMGAGLVIFGLVPGISGALDALESLDTLAPLTVIGSEEAVWELVGSAAYIDNEEIRSQGLPNINSVLAKVPGVYVREEDGFGNFPNISMRGADGTRSSKVTMMEDGILAAPAPYAAPAAYYSPKVGRMNGLEVLKGSSQVRYGPHTTGGVLNYLSTPVPDDFAFYTRNTYGSFDTLFSHTWFGDTVETDAGLFGYLLEVHGQQSGGYRDLPFGRDSGFRLFEPMLKLFWEPDTALKQRFEFKIGYSDFEADEGYLGLTEADARIRPDARYAATAFDNIDTEAWRSYLKWTAEPTGDLLLESALYWTRFERNWYKLDHVSGLMSPGVDGRGRIVGRTSLNKALLDPGLTRVLQGTAPGSTGVKANARSYRAFGWQNTASYRFDTGGASHELTGGVRFHYDRVFREQWVDIFSADGMGGFTPFRRGTPGEEGNRLEEVFATSFFIEDEIDFGALTLRPGFRYEYLDMASTDFNGGGAKMTDNLAVWSAGIGAGYEFDGSNRLYGGIYRGISTPGANSYINGTVREEESIGYELGFRHRNGGLTADIAAFFTDFDNLIGVDAGLGAGGGANRNAGEAEVWGFESLVAYDPGVDRGWSFGLPMYVSATWTSAELKQALAAGGSDNVYAGGLPGADIPYVPEWKLAAGIGYEGEQWGASLDAVYTSHSHGTAKNLAAPVTSVREGKIDSLLTFDLNGFYQINENFRIVGGVENIFDERAVITRIPEGPRTNAGRTFFAGFEAQF